jgi:hypothetical protein
LFLLNPWPVFLISVMAWASEGLGWWLFWDGESLMVLFLVLSVSELVLSVDGWFLVGGICLSVRSLAFSLPKFYILLSL